MLSLQIGEAAAGIYTTGLKLVEVACLPLGCFISVALLSACAMSCLPPQFWTPFEACHLRGSSSTSYSTAVLALAMVPCWCCLLLVLMLGERFARTRKQSMAAMAAIVLTQGIEILLGRLMLAANLNVARAVRITLGTLVCVLLTSCLYTFVWHRRDDRGAGGFLSAWWIYSISAICSAPCAEEATPRPDWR